MPSPPAPDSDEAADRRVLPTDALLEDPTQQGFAHLPTHRLIKAPWNYKEDHDKRQQKLENKIRRNGLIVNLVVRVLPNQTHDDGGPLFEPCDGNHRLDAVEAVGYDRVLCYNVGDVSQAHAERLAVELNEGDFQADPLRLAETLDRVTTEFDDFMETSPFEEDELDMYSDMVGFDWDEYDATESENGMTDAADADDDFATYEVTVPDEVVPVLDDAARRVEQELQDDGHELHEEDELRRGQVLEVLAAEYMASPQSPLNS